MLIRPPDLRPHPVQLRERVRVGVSEGVRLAEYRLLPPTSPGPEDPLREQLLAFYGRICGWTLSRAQRDPIPIASYLGKSDGFDRSIADFSRPYADQNERDYEAFTDAIRSGRLPAVEGL